MNVLVVSLGALGGRTTENCLDSLCGVAEARTMHGVTPRRSGYSSLHVLVHQLQHMGLLFIISLTD